MISFESYIENAVEWALANQHRIDYGFKCLAFVEDAFEQSNAIEMFGGSTAAESAEMYGVTGAATPPKGAFVFYDAHGPSPIDGVAKNWGHVGLCVGDGKVIHTWDRIRIDDYRHLEELGALPGWSPLRYRGWTPPEVFLDGHRARDWSGAMETENDND